MNIVNPEYVKPISIVLMYASLKILSSHKRTQQYTFVLFKEIPAIIIKCFKYFNSKQKQL